MRRKKRHEEHENHERWLVSYADFITLLFAFFVVMYAISSVNEGKYRVLSTTLVDAFQQDREGGAELIPIGEQARSPLPASEDPFAASMAPATSIEAPAPIEEPAAEELPGIEEDAFPLEPIAADIRSSLAPFIDQGLVEVTQNKYWVEVEIKSKMLFPSGSARLAPGALKALHGIAAILRPLPNVVNVEGHTDNLPIKTITFPSNWELSAARAASVVHLFTRIGINPERLAAIGYGEYRPIADNATDTGRQKNRRVSLVIMAQRREGSSRDFPVPPSEGGT
jgi:chemotaxis protein MotB